MLERPSPLATALSQAMLRSCGQTDREAVIFSGSVDPSLVKQCEAKLTRLDLQWEALAPDPIGMEDLLGRVDASLACVVVQNPGFFGHFTDYTPLAHLLKAEGGRLIMVAERDGLDLLPPLSQEACEWLIMDRPSPHSPHQQVAWATTVAERLEAEVAGLRVLPSAYFTRFAARLPHSAEPYEGLGCLPARRHYPRWPELDEVLLIDSLAVDNHAALDALISRLQVRP